MRSINSNQGKSEQANQAIKEAKMISAIETEYQQEIRLSGQPYSSLKINNYPRKIKWILVQDTGQTCGHLQWRNMGNDREQRKLHAKIAKKQLIEEFMEQSKMNLENGDDKEVNKS